MPGGSIPQDATIAEIMETLNNPEKYLRQVFGHMHECKSQFDSISVRIGVTGKARAPHYRVEYREGPEPWRHSTIFAVYNGLSHKQMLDLGELQINLDWDSPEGSPQKPTPEHLLMPKHWSSRTMNLDEVKAILGNLRRPRR